MSCILRIDGENFDVDGFLSISEIEPYEKYKKGQPKTIKLRGENFYKKSGCKFDLSLANFNEFEKQKIDVVNFLEANFLWLEKLEEFGLSKSEIPEIDFGINLNAEFSVEGFSIDTKLAELASDLNFSILISIYTM